MDRSNKMKRRLDKKSNLLFMSMNLTKLAKNLATKTSKNQKPHCDSFFLIGFKIEITMWF
ncbi:transposase, ISSmi2, partial [Streptococcus ratti FA-1 = DSM 20564]